VSTEPIAEFFDRECCATADAGSSPIPDADDLDEILLDALADAGFAGGTVLELGSGDGTLSRELVQRGAAAVTGVDLSPVSIEHATAAAKAAGVSDRLRYQVGDASAAALVAHDTVLSEKVFCCFPRPDGLLANSLPAARSIYALVLPESRGLAGFLTKILIGAENAWRRITREPFRAYVHDVRRIEEAIRAAGFERRSAQRHWGWLVLVFRRT
jgi:SAM-dependent methyltransferase